MVFELKDQKLKKEQFTTFSQVVETGVLFVSEDIFNDAPGSWACPPTTRTYGFSNIQGTYTYNCQ